MIRGVIEDARNRKHIKAAVALENTGVGGLLLKPTPANISPNGAFDKPKTAAQVLKAVEGTGFLK